MTAAPPDTDQDAAWKDILTRQYLPKIAILCLAVWLHAANSMLTATTMPTAVEDIGGLHLINWAFALYLMGSIVSGASISLLVSNFGLKRTMVNAAIAYGAGCAICALAPTMWTLLIGRTVQGLGGGALVALVYISQDRFFPNRFVPKLVAMISIVWMTAACMGPLIGGTFATLGIWRMAFWLFFAQALLLVLGVRVLLTKSVSGVEAASEPIPIIRLAFLAAAVVLISLAGARFHHFWSPVLIVSGVLGLVLFILRDRTAARSKMLSPQICDLTHTVGNGIVTTFLLCIAIMQFLIYGPFILIHLFGVTPLQAGLIVILETIGWTIGAIVFSGVNQTYERLIIRTGSAIVLAGLGIMAVVLPHGPIWLIMVIAFIGNSGFGMMWGFIIRRIIGAAAPGEKDRTSSILPTTQQLGFALGSAFCGVIANGLGLSEDASRETVQHITFWLFAGMIPLAALGNVTAWRFTGQPQPGKI